MSRYRGGAPTTTLYIRNLSDRARNDDIRRLFSKYGRIVDVTVPLDYYSGRCKGYCFIEFDDVRDAEEAQYRMDRQRVFGREIEIEFARGQRKTPGEMRTRDRDRRYPARNGYERRSRSRSRERRSDRRRSRSREGREASYNRPRSHSRHRSPNNVRNYSAERERSRSPRERSTSRPRDSPRRNGERASANRSMSRSPSPV